MRFAHLGKVVSVGIRDASCSMNRPFKIILNGFDARIDLHALHLHGA